jgi:hypothetical protein
MISSKKRCEANQSAWASFCPNQIPKVGACLCIGCMGQAIACVGGRCGLWCPPAVDAAPNAALDGAAVSDAGLHDTAVPDTDVHDVVLAGCTSLPVEWSEEIHPYACPPIANRACDPAMDVGATVARYNACLVSWGSVLFQCVGWPTLKDGQEFVVLTVEDCSYDVTIESLESCADSIQVEYLVQGTCSPCDGKRSNFRVLVLPRDARPVVAVSRGTVMPPCPPPPP